jgi:hypothetical protein
MIDKTSVKFILGFIAILVISFILFAGSVFVKNNPNAATLPMLEERQ